MAERVTADRRSALEVLRAVRGGDLADRALERHAGDLPARERAWVQELVYGTFRLRGRIDWVLDALVRGGVSGLEPDVLDVLRLGAYQLLEMGSVPAYAAVSQSVELARAAGAGRASGLVNGVLQAWGRRGAEVQFPDPERDPAGFLSTWGSHPRWLVERWLERWEPAEVRALVEANNLRPELYLTAIGLTGAEAAARLRSAGLEAEPVPFSPDSLRLGREVGARAALEIVPAVVQDPAAALVVRYADPPAGARVLDLCAAPGGKAIGFSARAAYVVAGDRSVRRLRRLRENVERLGLSERIGLVAADARVAPFAAADLVLLDAPCTGTGTLRRHPDGRWRVSSVDLGELLQLQAELLDAAGSLVAPGGLLVYSTCSLESEENESQVRGFLARHPGYILDPPVGRREVDPLVTDGFLHVLPQRHGVDGSFAARIRRVD